MDDQDLHNGMHELLGIERGRFCGTPGGGCRSDRYKSPESCIASLVRVPSAHLLLKCELEMHTPEANP